MTTDRFCAAVCLAYCAGSLTRTIKAVPPHHTNYTRGSPTQKAGGGYLHLLHPALLVLGLAVASRRPEPMTRTITCDDCGRTVRLSKQRRTGTLKADCGCEERERNVRIATALPGGWR